MFCKIWVLQESIIVNKLFLHPNILGVYHYKSLVLYLNYTSNNFPEYTYLSDY